jgi:hypothetical protein
VCRTPRCPMIKRMATRRWRPLLLVALFLLMFIGSTLVEMQLPRWLRPLTTTPILFVGTAAILYLAYRLWGPEWQAGNVRPARRADHQTPRPTLSAGRRAVAVGTAMCASALLVTAGLVAATVAWSTGHLTAGPDDGPPWYLATMLLGGSAGFAVLSVITTVQTYELCRTVAAVVAGTCPRWVATVQECRTASITVTAASIGGDDSGVRTVRINSNGLSLTDPLRVGDEILIDGHLRRASSVALHESDRTRWARTTWRQPTPRQRNRR